MIGPSFAMDPIGKVLKRARQAAIDYCRLIGKPLGIIGSARCPNAHQGFGAKLAIGRQWHPPQVPILKNSAFGLMTDSRIWLPHHRTNELFSNDFR